MTPGAAVEFAGVELGREFRGASRLFAPGAIHAVITTRDSENAAFLRLVAGLVRPDAGRVVVFGQDPSGLPREELSALRARVAITYPGGGLVSNLKAIENVTLPLLYHSDLPAPEIERKAADVLARLGYGGGLFELPGRLPLPERRLVGLARAMASDPDLVVHDRLLDGFDEEAQASVRDAAAAFHGEKAGRTSIFLTPAPDTVAGLPGCGIVHLRKGRLE